MIKKLTLLVNWDPKLVVNVRIGLVVASLPMYIREKLDYGEINSIDKFYLKINLLDRPSKTQNQGKTKFGNRFLPTKSLTHYVNIAKRKDIQDECTSKVILE